MREKLSRSITLAISESDEQFLQAQAEAWELPVAQILRGLLRAEQRRNGWRKTAIGVSRRALGFATNSNLVMVKKRDETN